MKLADFRTDRNGNPYGLKKCKYHCDYGDGEHCHYKEIDGCIYNKTKEEIDGQIKGRRMTDAESMGEPLSPVWKSECMNSKVDMVEVVRCKDCKHRYNGCCYNKETKRINFTIDVPDNWYCADGEKRGES